MSSRNIFIGAVVLLALGGFSVACTKKGESPSAQTSNSATSQATQPNQPQAAVSPTTEAGMTKPGTIDMTTDDNGLSKATAVIKTDKGVIKYKFYPKDAPNTVKRISDLIQQGFYNGLTFHRVVPGFVVQGGDPTGTGGGGTGVKLKLEVNKRRHSEGAVAMARAQDPDSADCQFYITLGVQPHLDSGYTVFGQVVEGQDVVRKLQMGDKMTSVTIE